LLQAAQRAIHRDGPQISMDEIAAEAGITKPIFYRHFGDRRGLARALRDSAFGLMVGAPSDDTPSNRRVARERIAAFYPVVSDPDHLRRVVVGWATGFQMFVEMNRNLYGFLRAEGVMDSMWEEPDANMKEPVAESLAASLRAVFADRGIDRVLVPALSAAACVALGLSEGPVHAELRVNDAGPWVLEVAARSIGGLCSRTLRFGTGISHASAEAL
jgi:AcrR family transcriptional regulator